MHRKKMGRRCKGKNANGRPCGGFAVHGDDYCIAHTHLPTYVRKRQVARVKGGLGAKIPDIDWSNTPDTETIDGLRSYLDEIRETAKLIPNSVQRFRALIALFREYVNLLQVGELEERIRAVEDLLDHREVNSR